MHYCINALLKNNNEIMQYCIIINDIALIMHYRALLDMSESNSMSGSNTLHLYNRPLLLECIYLY